MYPFRKKPRFYGEELLAPCPTPKLGDHSLSAVRDCLFNILAVTLHIGGRSSIRNQWTHHAVVTVIQLSWVSYRVLILLLPYLMLRPVLDLPNSDYLESSELLWGNTNETMYT